ncbi:MAG: hypothetical protein HDS03_06610 [Bacteroides sp.]|nr:hypothetical protein [Bacteroides sp.]
MAAVENNETNRHCRKLENNSDGCPRGKLYATNWLADISSSADFDPVQVVFKNTRTGFYTNPNKLDLKIDDIVAVEAAPGHDIGRVSMVGKLVKQQMKKSGVSSDAQLKRVFRFATDHDIEKFDQARAREHDTMIRARKIAEELELNMKIGDVEYQGDGGKAIFYYIADERVDFRKLIRILADTFKVRIEMKQIGARQEAGRIGGIGPCGRPLCCSSWMTHFVSVGTGAARVQDLSMNPQKLAGQCAKLKCCLNFEIDSYSEAHRKLPPKDAVLETKDGNYFYFKPDILARKVTYSTDKSVPANLVTIDASRAFEIIALNKQGIKVDALEPENGKSKPAKEYIDLVEQESLTRFDKSKKKKKKGNGGNNNGNNKGNANGNNNNANRQPANANKPKGNNPNNNKKGSQPPKPQQPNQINQGNQNGQKKQGGQKNQPNQQGQPVQPRSNNGQKKPNRPKKKPQQKNEE